LNAGPSAPLPTGRSPASGRPQPAASPSGLEVPPGQPRDVAALAPGTGPLEGRLYAGRQVCGRPVTDSNSCENQATHGWPLLSPHACRLVLHMRAANEPSSNRQVRPRVV